MIRQRVSNKQKNRIRGFFSSYIAHLAFFNIGVGLEIEKIQDDYMEIHNLPLGVDKFETLLNKNSKTGYFKIKVYCRDNSTIIISL